MFPWHTELLSRCWHKDPLQKPIFEEKVRDLESGGYKHIYGQCEHRKKHNDRDKGLSLRVMLQNELQKMSDMQRK